jgi:hypothetical protein
MRGPEVGVGSVLWVRRPSRDRAFCAPQEGTTSFAEEQRPAEPVAVAGDACVKRRTEGQPRAACGRSAEQV